MSFLNDIKPHVLKSTSKILPSVTSAQAILESARGTSELARNANNLFGIKGDYNGQSYTINTKEYLNGKWTTVDAAFKKYPSFLESINDHGAFFTSTPWRTNNYKAVLNATDYKTQARALQSSGYATDPSYANKLINLIESEGLASWDNQKGGQTMSQMTIAVSKGHGGFGVTPGKRSPAGEYEWHFNDKVADAFIAYMKDYPVRILEVSDPSGRTDTPLMTRTNRANNARALLYVAFHHNANTGRWGNWTGSEVWVRPNAPQAAALARRVAPKVSKAMNITNRGVKAGNLHEVREPNQHAILIEGGFMDSRIDITAMRRNDMLAAQGRAVAQGVVEYYNLKRSSGGSSKPSSPSKPSSNKITGSTYTVKKGDTLWSISQRSGASVNNIKSWSGISSDSIKPGQKLTVKKPKSSSSKKSTSSSAKTGGVKNIKYKENNWRRNNSTGAYWTPVDATFVVTRGPIYTYDGSPQLNRSNRAPSLVQNGAKIKVLELARNDKHVWICYKTDSGSIRYMPIKKWNGGGGRVTNSGLWGYFA